MADVTLADLSWKEKAIPLGCLSLTAALEETGFGVDLRPYSRNNLANPQDPKCMAEFIAKGSAEIIGLGAMAVNLPHVILAAERIKEKHPEKVIILGGPGPSEVANELLHTFPFVDIIVHGEGERTFPELVNSIQSGNALGAVAGISFRSGGQVKFTRPRPSLENLDDLPLPAFHKLKLKDYFLLLESSRGCPFSCTFCSSSQFWGRQHRRKSVGRVLEEVKLLEEHKARDFRFVDDTFVLNEKWVYDFCRQFKQEALDLPWTCQGRVDLMNEPLMSELASANCVSLFYGVESGSNDVLKQINKAFTIETAERVVLKSMDYFENVVSSFIYGFPFETMEDFQKTLLTYLGWSERYSRLELGMHLLSAYKSSPLYKQYRQHTKFYPKYFREFSASYWSDDPGLSQSALKLIIDHPEIFCSFYTYQSPLLKKKAETMACVVRGMDLRKNRVRFRGTHE